MSTFVTKENVYLCDVISVIDTDRVGKPVYGILIQGADDKLGQFLSQDI